MTDEKLPAKDDWSYWYKTAEDIINANTKDKITNLMGLAMELRNQYQLGIQHGVRDSNSGHR